ncbi:MAG: hypothetical protein WBQ78_02605 [Gammaproteobacteria bacterium]
MVHAPGKSSSALALLVLLAAALLPCQAPAQPQEHPVQGAADVRLQTAAENLASIQRSVEAKRSTLRELREQLKTLEEATERQEVERKIERIRNEVAELQQSFEHIALGNINLSVLADQPEQPIDWRVEIEEISRPLLSSVKELTAKPRQLDSLRRDIERQENQLKVIDKALESIRLFSTQDLPPAAADPIRQLLVTWEQRRDDTERALEISRFKRDSLKSEGIAWRASSGEAIKEFFTGRGLTLLLAVAIGTLIWLILKLMLKFYLGWAYRTPRDIGVTRAPLVLYSFRLATAALIIVATLMVFYVRGDVLFLTLALIALAGAALALRQTLPRYAAEIRLLLGVGPVRENERLVLDGIPLLVESLSVFSVLRNPALEGVVRLPLHAMNDFASRPAGEEPWFPCQPGDFLLLDNGSLGRVLRQTIELVEIGIQDAVLQVRTRDLLGQNVRNLSREGFGIAGTFGIDYQHQAICLDTVPGRFREAILERFRQAGFGDDIRDILVEFKIAGASSLDYQIYLVLKGSAAKAYFKAQRLVQQACVDTCNREGWVIPFTQITVHTAESGQDQVAGATAQQAARPAAG